MFKTRLTVLFPLLALGIFNISYAQDIPSINPTFSFTNADGLQENQTECDENAPLSCTFYANIENDFGYQVFYDWRFYNEGGSPEKPEFSRKDLASPTVTFTTSGRHLVALYATFVNGTDTIRYDYENYWADATPLSITIKSSKLEVPNAFSPNGDGTNDIFRVKQDSYQSIVSFKATIFNRWGQKLYQWTDITGGWDGKFHGTDVKQGVYYVHVEARGADGIVYDIKRDVNLLRGYTAKDGSSGN